MERKSAYDIIRPPTHYVEGDSFHCECGKYLGKEINMRWYHQRRGKWIDSKCFLRIIDGEVVAKIFVRGEIGCKCGKRQVWHY